MAQNTYRTITTSILGQGIIYPLTTIWTPPCESAVPFDYIDTSTSCAPPEYSRVWYNYGYYSPGICPSGYTIGCTAESANLQVPLQSGETAMVCVPSNYKCASSFNKHATSVGSGGAITSVPAFDIRWRQQDLQFLETNPLSPGAQVTGTGSDTPTETGAGGAGSTKPVDTTSTPQPASGGSSFGAGPIAGVVVGVVCILIAVGAVGFWMWRRRKQRTNQGLPQTQQNDHYTGPPELPGSTMHQAQVQQQHQDGQGLYNPTQQPPMAEMGQWTQQPHLKEMDAQPPVSEMDGRIPPPMVNEMYAQPPQPHMSEMYGGAPPQMANEMYAQPPRPFVGEMDGRTPPPMVNEMDGQQQQWPVMNEMAARTPQPAVSELATYTNTEPPYAAPPAAWEQPQSMPTAPANSDWQAAPHVPATTAAPVHFYNNPTTNHPALGPESGVNYQTPHTDRQT